tara:strand:+ start:77 stop:778 length:702 start_codon:yes stop_codon:yes gene_type:complete
MIDNQKILAVVPARGGSKGIPLKNLKEINGSSLIEIVAKLIKEIPIIDRSIVSTDNQSIKNEANKYGLDSPFTRSKELSGDLIGDHSVLKDALLKIEEIDQTTYDIIVMLQPTSPLRLESDVTGAIKKLVKGGYESVWTVSKTDLKFHPDKQLIIKNGNLKFFNENGKNIIARQQLKDTYHRNGVAYVVTRKCLLNELNLLGQECAAFIIDKENISIDTLDDIEKISKIMNSK